MPKKKDAGNDVAARSNKTMIGLRSASKWGTIGRAGHDRWASVVDPDVFVALRSEVWPGLLGLDRLCRLLSRRT